MAQTSRMKKRGKVVEALYFGNIGDLVEKLGAAYPAQIAGTPSSTGLQPQGFVISSGGA